MSVHCTQLRNGRPCAKTLESWGHSCPLEHDGEPTTAPLYDDEQVNKFAKMIHDAAVATCHAHLQKAVRQIADLPFTSSTRKCLKAYIGSLEAGMRALELVEQDP